MKYLIIFSSIFSLQLSLHGQGFKIVAVSNNNRVDSVTLGFVENASIGIDTGLGEANIFNQPAQTFDMRVIQRDSINFSCTYTFWLNANNTYDTLKHFFPVKFDSKMNFRSKRDTSFINRLFEIKFFSKNIKRLFVYPLNPNQFLDYSTPNLFRYYLDSCLGKPQPITYVWNPSNPTIYSDEIASTPISNIVILFPKGFLLDSKETINTKPRVYPNPASDVLTIDNIEVGKVKALRLFDILGREVLNQKVEGSESVQLNVSQLSRGTYLLTLYNDALQPIFTKTVIK
jgi:hypothetical protein